MEQDKPPTYLSTNTPSYLLWRRTLLRLRKSSLETEHAQPRKERQADGGISTSPDGPPAQTYEMQNALREVLAVEAASQTNSIGELALTAELGSMALGSSNGSSLRLLGGSGRGSRARRISGKGGGESVQEAYQFIGMHHVLELKAPVRKIAFANNDAENVAVACTNGLIYLCRVLRRKQTLHVLRGHTKEVTDFDWSQTNEYLISGSLDKSVRVWNTQFGNCIRSINCPEGPVSVVRFVPINNNRFIVGVNTGIYVYNFSTGTRETKKPTVKLPSSIGCVSFAPRGDWLFVGDSVGSVHVLRCFMEGSTVTFDRFGSVATAPGVKRPITSIAYSSWIRGKAERPFLLVNASTSTTLLYELSKAATDAIVDSPSHHLHLTPGRRRRRPKTWNVGAPLTFISRFRYESALPTATISPRQRKGRRRRKEKSRRARGRILRSVFCPLISSRRGACFVSACEDSAVYVFDLTRSKQKNINSIMGHQGAVVDVAWNYDESLLASADSRGTVICWKRKPIEEPESTQS